MGAQSQMSMEAPAPFLLGGAENSLGTRPMARPRPLLGQRDFHSVSIWGGERLRPRGILALCPAEPSGSCGLGSFLESWCGPQLEGREWE